MSVKIFQIILFNITFQIIVAFQFDFLVIKTFEKGCHIGKFYTDSVTECGNIDTITICGKLKKLTSDIVYNARRLRTNIRVCTGENDIFDVFFNFSLIFDVKFPNFCDRHPPTYPAIKNGT